MMSEMEQTADHVLVIGRGHLVADMPMNAFTQRSALSHVRVVSTQAKHLVQHLRDQGGVVTNGTPNELTITGLDVAAVGAIAFEHRILLNELSTQRASLEDAFMEITRDSVQYRAGNTDSQTVNNTNTLAPATVLAGERI
jgi:ABC-2 type transport system ATP-binding protein